MERQITETEMADFDDLKAQLRDDLADTTDTGEASPRHRGTTVVEALLEAMSSSATPGTPLIYGRSDSPQQIPGPIDENAMVDPGLAYGEGDHGDGVAEAGHEADTEDYEPGEADKVREDSGEAGGDEADGNEPAPATPSHTGPTNDTSDRGDIPGTDTTGVQGEAKGLALTAHGPEDPMLSDIEPTDDESATGRPAASPAPTTDHHNATPDPAAAESSFYSEMLVSSPTGDKPESVDRSGLGLEDSFQTQSPVPSEVHPSDESRPHEISPSSVSVILEAIRSPTVPFVNSRLSGKFTAPKSRNLVQARTQPDLTAEFETAPILSEMDEDELAKTRALQVDGTTRLALRRTFEELDKDEDGLVLVQDILGALSLSQETVHRVLRAEAHDPDLQKDIKVDFDKFVLMTSHPSASRHAWLPRRILEQYRDVHRSLSQRALLGLPTVGDIATLMGIGMSEVIVHLSERQAPFTPAGLGPQTPLGFDEFVGVMLDPRLRIGTGPIIGRTVGQHGYGHEARIEEDAEGEDEGPTQEPGQDQEPGSDRVLTDVALRIFEILGLRERRPTLNLSDIERTYRVDTSQAIEMIRSADLDGDGEISFPEFYAVFCDPLERSSWIPPAAVEHYRGAFQKLLSAKTPGQGEPEDITIENASSSLGCSAEEIKAWLKAHPGIAGARHQTRRRSVKLAQPDPGLTVEDLSLLMLAFHPDETIELLERTMLKPRAKPRTCKGCTIA